MRSMKVQKTLGSFLSLKNMFRGRKLFVKNKDKFSTWGMKTRRQSMCDKDQDIRNNVGMFQTVISRSCSGLETSESKSPQNTRNSCYRLKERLVQRKVSLPSGKVEQELYYTRYVDVVDVSSSESGLKTWFDLYLEEQTQGKIAYSQFQLNLEYDSDTTLVDGLLTTTLCSTEL